MISSSQIIADALTPPQARATADDLPFEPSNFDVFFRTTHPEKAKLAHLVNERRLVELCMNAFIVPR
jgi:hypothetical protein